MPVCLNMPQWAWLTVAGLLLFMVGLYIGTWSYVWEQDAEQRDRERDHRPPEG